MQHFPSLAQPWSLATLPQDERQRVADMAALLAEASRAGQPSLLLRGKNLAVMCDEAAQPGPNVVCRAAGALGARVTQIRPSDALRVAQGPGAVGHVLGRLYDAIDCYGVEPDVIDWLTHTTGRPVFNALGEQAGSQTQGAGLDEFTLQALLVNAFSWT